MMRGISWMIVAAVLASGCVSQEYGQCPPPDDHLEVLYKAKNPAHPFSHPFCVVCNTELEEDGYNAWSQQMGGTGNIADEDLGTVHPCLYVYGDGSEIKDFEQCQSLVCDGGATYSDMVGKGQGNFDVKPILFGDGAIASEWLLLNYDAALSLPPPIEHMAPAASETQLP
jgi:hypothetical protein